MFKTNIIGGNLKTFTAWFLCPQLYVLPEVAQLSVVHGDVTDQEQQENIEKKRKTSATY